MNYDYIDPILEQRKAEQKAKKKAKRERELLIECRLYEGCRIFCDYYERNNGETQEWKIHEISKIVDCEDDRVRSFLASKGLPVPSRYSNVNARSK